MYNDIGKGVVTGIWVCCAAIFCVGLAIPSVVWFVDSKTTRPDPPSLTPKVGVIETSEGTEFVVTMTADGKVSVRAVSGDSVTFYGPLGLREGTTELISGTNKITIIK